jgi:thiamine biosynthesis protein ThiI
MNHQCILIHYHEISLKGDNRSWFEKHFVENIKTQLNSLPYKKIKIVAARIFIIGIDRDCYEEYEKCLKNVMGLKNAYVMSRSDLNIDAINSEVQSQIQDLSFSTFRVSTKRQDKNFQYTSQDVNQIIGAAIVAAYSKKVSLDNPDLNIIIEIVNGKAYIGYRKIIGYGGLPIGTGEKALSLISSGIDSPVASFLLAKRGVDVHYIHFHSVPSTSIQSINNVKSILMQLSKYQIQCSLYSVPLLSIQEKIMKNISSKYWVIFFRKAMYSISELLAKQLNINALITGENVGQVASQTISNIRAASDAVNIPVLRPLAGMNKEEIVNIAEDIGTYEISIKPYEDCCSFFVPKHPATSANLADVKNMEKAIRLEQYYEDLLQQITEERISIYE